jgi:hypothetical protein
MALEKRILVTTSFYVNVIVDYDLTLEEEDEQVKEICERIANNIETKIDYVERIKIDKLEDAKVGQLINRVIR